MNDPRSSLHLVVLAAVLNGATDAHTIGAWLGLDVDDAAQLLGELEKSGALTVVPD